MYRMPVILNTCAAYLISFGIIFKPPITVNTIFQTIERKRIKIAAALGTPREIKNIISTGKNASTGIDSKISNVGRRIPSAMLFSVARIANGIATTIAQTYAINNRPRV